MYFRETEHLLVFYICFQQKKKKRKWRIYVTQINKIPILHLFESYHVYT